jgi:hypothetical protein
MKKMNPTRPIQFLYQQNGEWKINPEAKKILENHWKPVKVLCIAGKFRQGKSYILNNYLGVESNGFELGHQISGKTKGIWMWMKEEEEECSTICLDTEGLFDVENDSDTDAQIFLLSMLLSSYLIINVSGTLDQNIIEDCQVVTELSTHIKVSNEQDIENSSNVINHALPRLLFLIRDFHFDFGQFKDSRDYLMKTLGKTEKIVNPIKDQRKKLRNEIRATFLNSFKEGVDCETLICPVNNMEENLSKMETDPSVIKLEFKSQVGKLIKKINGELKVKKMVSCENVDEFNEVTGDGFIKMTENFVNQLNSGESFNIGSTFELVLESQTNQLFSSAISKYEKEMKELQNQLPMKRKDFYELSDSIFSKLSQEATRKAFVHSKQKLLNDLIIEGEKISKIHYQVNLEKGEKECERVWSIISKSFFSNLDQKKYKTFEDAGEAAIQLKEVLSLKINMNCPIEVVQKFEIEKKNQVETALATFQHSLNLSIKSLNKKENITHKFC